VARMGDGDLQFVKHALVSRQVQRSGQRSSSTAATVPRYWRMERWADDERALLHIRRPRAHADASPSGRISAVHREARKWQVASRQTSSAGPIGQRSISSRLGLGSTAVTGVALAALLGMPCQPSLVRRFQDFGHGSREAARLPTPVHVKLCLSVPDLWINCHPPRTQRTGAPISLVPRPALHCCSLNQTPPAPLDKSTASAVPDAAHL
jgi:hypothetical protein